MRAIAIGLADEQEAITPRDEATKRSRTLRQRLAGPRRAGVGRGPRDASLAGRSGGGRDDDQAGHCGDIRDRTDVPGVGKLDQLPAGGDGRRFGSRRQWRRPR